jgi:hypothetical protein
MQGNKTYLEGKYQTYNLYFKDTPRTLLQNIYYELDTGMKL